MTQSSLIARTGQSVSGQTLQSPMDPRRNAAGAVYYRDRSLYRYAPAGTTGWVVGLGDVRARQRMSEIDAFAVNDLDSVAFHALLFPAGHEGVFVDESPIAIEQLTYIDQLRVKEIGDGNAHMVAVNPSGQVAFVAELEDSIVRLFVATPLPEDLDSNGDGRIGVEDYEGFSDCVTGPGEWVTPDCRVFDLNGDCVVDLVDLALFQAAFANMDCNGNGIPDIVDIFRGDSVDCNSDTVPDDCEVAAGTAADANSNGIPDACDADCNGNGTPDDLDIAQGASPDCDGNAIPDFCDLAAGTSPDCNSNGVPDSCDLILGGSLDCSGNGTPDECEPDCDANGFADSCDILGGTSRDCNGNDVPDGCEVASGTAADCDFNGVPDSCDPDCDNDGVPDACEAFDDCNSNGIRDLCDIAAGTSVDWNVNGVPDECEQDCNSNGIPDQLELPGNDCDGNGTLDDCEPAENDCNGNGTPDACEFFGYALAYEIPGEAGGDLFGYDLEPIADVNDDGRADLVVSAVFARGDGSVYLYGLGPASASLLARVDGFDRFGYDLSAVGDVNGDGVPDYAAGGPFEDVFGDNQGVVAVISGSNRTIGGPFSSHPGVLRTLDRSGTSTGNQVGGLISQGRLLLATRADNGHAYVINGSTGADVAHFIGGGAPFARISDTGEMNQIGDVIGQDGIADFVVTEDGNLNGTRGTVFVLNGTIITTTPRLITLAASLTLVGDRLGDLIGQDPGGGQGASGLLDVSGDGRPDILVGAFQADVVGSDSGSALVYSGASGALLYRINGTTATDQFGSAVSSLGDLNGDGAGDFVVGAPGGGSRPGWAYVYNGLSRSSFQSLSDTTHGYGSGVADIDDLNGDGVHDLAVTNYAAASGRGKVYIYVSNPPPCTLRAR